MFEVTGKEKMSGRAAEGQCANGAAFGGIRRKPSGSRGDNSEAERRRENKEIERRGDNRDTERRKDNASTERPSGG